MGATAEPCSGPVRSTGRRPPGSAVFLLATLLAAVLAAAILPVVRRVVAGGYGSRTWAVVPVAVVVAAVLEWAVSRVVEPSSAVVVGFTAVAVVLAMQLVIDLETHRLPRQISYAGLLVLAATVLLADGGRDRIVSSVVGALVMTAITVGFVALTRGSLGIGDVHLSPLLGALAGWFGFLTAIAIAWVVTAVVGGVVVALGLALRRLDRTDHVPYGPFLVLGTLASCVISAVAR